MTDVCGECGVHFGDSGNAVRDDVMVLAREDRLGIGLIHRTCSYCGAEGRAVVDADDIPDDAPEREWQ